MNWKPQFTDKIAEGLGFFIRGAMLLNGIILALASIYLLMKLTVFTLRYLDRVWFSHPW